MKKKVNIYPRGPITSVNPPIRVPVKNVTKDVKDIRKCIIANARVDEITPNGLVSLNLQNYDLDNGADYDIIEKGINMYAADKTLPAQEPALADDKAAKEDKYEVSIGPVNNPIDPVVEDNNDYGEDVVPVQEPIDKVEEKVEEEAPAEESEKVEEEEVKEEAPVETVDAEADADEELETMDVDDILGDNTAASDTEEEAPKNQNLTKKQRKALKRVEAAKVNPAVTAAEADVVEE